jgi:iron complex outermembrane receptor protein
MVRQGVYNMADLDKIMPDLEISFNASTLSVATIRGVQIGSWGPLWESIVSTHLDGIFIAPKGALDNHFFDIERVEVLKGPQGTLYGRGATAGTINIITRKPEMDIFSGHAEIEFGNYDLMRTEGAINLPVNDTFAIRTAFRSLKRDGYYETSGYDNADSRSMRFSALWEPTERASLLLTADFEHYDIKGTSMTLGDQYIGTYGDFTILTPPDAVYDINKWVDQIANVDFNRSDVWGMMGQFDYNFDFATGTVQYSHRSMFEDQKMSLGARALIPITFDANGDLTVGDFFGIQNTALGLSSTVDHAQNALELRLTSNTDTNDPLEWVVGANYFEENVVQVASGSFVVYWADLEAKSLAAFGQATWTPIERLHFTGGLRWNDDEKTMTSDVAAPIGPPTESATGEYDEITYKAVISYDLTDENMVYAQFSHGYRVGNIEPDLVVGPEETLDAYEIGSKNRFFDDRLQINLEAYYYDYPVIPQWVEPAWCILDVDNDGLCEDADGDGVVTANDSFRASSAVAPGGAEQKGVSVSLIWLLTNQDRVTANIAYQDNKFGSYDMPAAVLEQYPQANNTWEYDDQSGLRFGPPQWRGNLSYTRIFNIGENDLIEITGDLYYEGEAIENYMRLNDPEEYIMPGRDAYWLGDLSARYTSSFGMPAGMVWNVRAWAKNIWNSDDLATKSYSDFDRALGYIFPPRSGIITGTYVRPRTFGIAVGAQW